MVLEFYYDLLSQPCRALYVFMKTAGVDFESKTIELTKGKTCRLTAELKVWNLFIKQLEMYMSGFLYLT